MKAVIVGSTSILGPALRSACSAVGVEVEVMDHPDVNLTLLDEVLSNLPEADWVIHCADFMDELEAEDQPRAAFAWHTGSCANLATACRRFKQKFMMISTHYVFDGKRPRPYGESNRPSPLNVFGASKYAAERAVRSVGGEYVVVRTSSLFGPNGTNLVDRLVTALVKAREPLRLPQDRQFSPTYTRHFAEALVHLLPLPARGLLHISASGACSPFELAREISARIGIQAPIEPVGTAALLDSFRWPVYSVLDNSQYEKLTGHRVPTWQDGLRDYFADYGIAAAPPAAAPAPAHDG